MLNQSLESHLKDMNLAKIRLQQELEQSSQSNQSLERMMYDLKQSLQLVQT